MSSSLAGRASHVCVIAAAVVVLAACSSAPPTPASSADATGGSLPTDCRAAFQAWVDNASSLNSPDTELADTLEIGDQLERRVFEVCSLADAERYNREILVQYGSGIQMRLIDPDIRTFADAECVDESPLLDGTPLCAEVGH